MEIDSELLIALVEARPVLWDKFIQIYKDRNATKNGWHEICLELQPDFDTLEINDKNAFGKQVISKWTNLRDSFSKYNKRIKALKARGSGTKRLKKYVYFDQMKFLDKVYLKSENVNSIQQKNVQNDIGEENIELGARDTTTVVRKSQKRKDIRNHDEVELTFLKPIEGDKPCSKMSFLQSIMPHLQKYDDEEFLQFQMDVLNVIRIINGKKKSMYSNPTTPHFSQLPSYQLPFARSSTNRYRREQCFDGHCQSFLQSAPIYSEKQSTSTDTKKPILNQSQPPIGNNPATDISSNSSEGSGQPSPASHHFSQFTNPEIDESVS